MSSDDLRFLYKKQINQFQGTCIKTTEFVPGEEVVRFEQSEVKDMVKKMTKFRDECYNVREFEEESVKFVTDKYKRYFFNSKWAQRFYRLNNAVASTGLGYWGYRAVGSIGNANQYLRQQKLLESFVPIAYFTRIRCRF